MTSGLALPPLQVQLRFMGSAANFRALTPHVPPRQALASMFPVLHEREARFPQPGCGEFGAVMVRSSCSLAFYYEFVGK